jgi:hypothetical protein
MPQRNSLNAIEDLSDLNHLDEIVVDKRSGQRASAKKNRRNRHYEKQFIRNSLTHRLMLDRTGLDEPGALGEPLGAADTAP